MWADGDHDCGDVGPRWTCARGDDFRWFIGEDGLPDARLWLADSAGVSAVCLADEMAAIRAWVAGDVAGSRAATETMDLARDARFAAQRAAAIAETERLRVAAEAARKEKAEREAAGRVEMELARRLERLVAAANAPESDYERAARAAHAAIVRGGRTVTVAVKHGRKWRQDDILALANRAVDITAIPWATTVQDLDPTPLARGHHLRWVQPDPDGGCMGAEPWAPGATPVGVDWGAVADLAAAGVAFSGGRIFVLPTARMELVVDGIHHIVGRHS